MRWMNPDHIMEFSRPVRRGIARRHLRRVLLSMAAGMALASSSQGQQIWTGLASSRWTDPGNWSGQQQPPNDGTADLLFPSLVPGQYACLVDRPWNIRSLTFSDSHSTSSTPYVITGHLLTIGPGGITNLTPYVQTIANDLRVAESQIWTAGTGGLALSGDVKLENGALRISGTGPVVFTGTVDVANALYNFRAETDVTFSGPEASLNLARHNFLGPYIAAGKTLRIERGASLNWTGFGAFNRDNPGAIEVTGAQSRIIADTGVAHTFGSNSQLRILDGACFRGHALQVGQDSAASIIVDGQGTRLDLVGGIQLGQGVGTGTARFSNQAVVNTGAGLFVNRGSAEILSGASVTGTVLSAGSVGPSTIDINGIGTSVQVGGALLVGTSASARGVLNVTNGASLTASGYGFVGSVLVSPQLGTRYGEGTLKIDAAVFTLAGELTLQGKKASLTRMAAGTLNLTDNASLIISGGARANLAGDYALTSRAKIQVIGEGSLLSAGSLAFSGGSELIARDAGAIVSSGGLNLAIGSNALLRSQGSGTSITAGGDSWWGSNGGQATVELVNEASAKLGNLYLATGSAGSSTSISIRGGGQLTAGNIDAAGPAAGPAGTVSLSVSDPDSALKLPEGILTLGRATDAPASLTICKGGSFQARATVLNKTGTITLEDASADLGTLTHNGGSIRLVSGALRMAGQLNIRPGGPLGSAVDITQNRSVAVAGNTLIYPASSLSLNGGQFSTDRLANQGSLNLNSGTLWITGPEGLSVGTAGMLSAAVQLNPGMTLRVANRTVIEPGGNLTVNGGQFAGSSLVNSDTVVVRSGILHLTGEMRNEAVGRAFIASNVTVAGALDNRGTITVLDGIGSLGGAGLLSNAGLITGDGCISKPVLNGATGEIRVQSGKTLILDAMADANRGTISLQGGTVQFNHPLVNASGGSIKGDGTLIVHGDGDRPGLSNYGTIALSTSQGLNRVFGQLRNEAGGSIVIAGGSSTTFFGAVSNEPGATFYVGRDSRATFLGPVSGAGMFTGPGIKSFESPDNSLGALISAGATVVEAGAGVTSDVIRETSLVVAGQLTIRADRGISVVEQLTIEGDPEHRMGMLDLGNNGLVIHATPETKAAVLAAVSRQIALARNGQEFWGSQGITSSSARANPLTGLIPVVNDRGGGVPIVTSFGGLAVGINDVLIAYGWNGDANLDGLIDADDYHRLDMAITSGITTPRYQDGDYNLDGRVNADDYFLLDRAYVGQAGSLASGSRSVSVPEPGFACLLAAGAMLLLYLPGRRIARI